MKILKSSILSCSLALVPVSARAADATTAPEETAAKDRERRTSLHQASTLDGASGLLRLRSADSGAVGTFRLALLANLYSGSNFLCPPCENAQGAVSRQGDDVNVFGTRALLSVTPLSFLEAYATLRYQSTSNNRATPVVIPIFGDTSFGAKGFLPSKPDRIYGFGGGFSLGLLSPTDGVGVTSANVELYAAGTLDLTKLPAPSRLPLRVHGNLGYTFDNSGKIADSLEASRASVLGKPRPITRAERFGYGINRVDALKWGIGVEGAFELVRPFAEWSMDIPTNRQGYRCQNTYKTAGDRCLAKDQTFSSVPSRVSLGVRGYPWLATWAEGLALQASVDIGTGATSNFVEEVAPEAPYSVYFGIGYAFDTQPRIQRVVQTKLLPAAAPAAKPQRQFFVYGTVVDAETAQPVKAAGVYFEGTDQNAMLTASNGSFRTAPLSPGEHRFVIRKDDYREGQCQALITDVAPSKAPAAPAPTNGPGEVTEIKCEITALPRVATVTGTVRSADTTEFVNNATIVAKDDRGRSASVRTDADGRFRFENVPAGKVRLEASADGFMSSVTEIELQPRVPSTSLLLLNKRPAQANVVLTKNELKLKRQVHFLFDSSEIQPDSAAILEEIADVLRQHTELGFIEIQGHTDDVGSPEHNLRLSEDRAGAVRDALQRLGVDGNRLSARGYGKQKPLVPNTSPQNRAKNRRVQLMIQNP